MAAPVVERMEWDKLPVGDTRPAMKGGVPFWLVFPIFFVPCILVLVTFRIWWLATIPFWWFGIAACYAGNPNRPFEWLMYLISGAAFASWRPWGGISVDPHGTHSDRTVYR